MRYCIFAYDFPHRKTNAFMRTMARLVDDYIVVIAAPYVEITHEKPLIQWEEKPVITPPRDVAHQLGMGYVSIRHEDCLELLDQEQPDVAVIAGSRILPKEVINQFPYGVVNFHNGLLPINRGLDCMKWAIHGGLPQGVTAHLISPEIDLGYFIAEQVVDVWPNDDFRDIAERMFVAQRMLLKSTVRLLERSPDGLEGLHSIEGGTPHSRMKSEIERETIARFDAYKRHYSDLRAEWCP